MEGQSSKKRVRDDLDESRVDSAEVKKLREDLLENLEDDELCTAIQDLDSFMKSFEEEITVAHSSTATVTVVDLTSDSGEAQPDLGYLLEASDDELGLPPSTASPVAVGNEEGAELVRVSSDSSELSELWGFDEQIPSYDSFEFGVGGTENLYGVSGEYVALDGLFDYSDMGFGPADFAFRPETLPAQ